MNKMAYTERGSTKKFFCKFHGWAYDLDGRLVGVPDEKCFMGLKREEHGLSPVHLEVGRGSFSSIWIARRVKTLSQFLSLMHRELEGYPFEKMTSCYSWSAVVNCNWKLALDAFQETYHVSYVHGRSIAGALLKSDAGGGCAPSMACAANITVLVDCRKSQSVYGNPNALTSASNGEAPASANRPIGEAALRFGRGGARFDVAQEDLPKAINWTRHPNWAFDINVSVSGFLFVDAPQLLPGLQFQAAGPRQILVRCARLLSRNDHGGRSLLPGIHEGIPA